MNKCSGGPRRSCFTILQTYTSSKSGLSTGKAELNLGDASISFWVVNEETS
jgi:hypothetical protein